MKSQRGGVGGRAFSLKSSGWSALEVAGMQGLTS